MTKRAIWFLGLLLLLATILVPAILWRNSGRESIDPGPPITSLDVVAIGRVDVEGSVRSLDPPQPGRVSALHVTEGADVKAGQPIYSIDDRLHLDFVQEAKLARDQAKIALDVAKARAQAQPAEIEALQKRIDAANETARANEAKLQQMKRQLELSSAVPVTKADIDSFEAQLRSLRLNIAAEQIRLDAVKMLDPNLEVQAAQVQLDSATDAVARAEQQRDACTIKAPSDGTIIRIRTGVGAMLAPSTPMSEPAVTFAPAAALIVRAEVDQADAGRVQLNMKATLKDETRRDSPVWTGKVVEISRWIARKRSMNLDPGEFNDVRTLEVVIRLDPSNDRLWIGQRMVVRFTK